MIKQKVVASRWQNDFVESLQHLLNNGWQVVPTTLVYNEMGIVCVVQQDIPEKMPCFAQKNVIPLKEAA